MIKKHNLDLERSQTVYEQCADDIRIKECYANVFRVAYHFPEQFMLGEWKIAYGYMQVFEKLYVRHCFIVNDAGWVIDPTSCLFSKNKDTVYLSFTTLNYDEFFNLVIDHDFRPALEKAFPEEEKAAWEYAKENDLFFIG